MSVAEIHGIFQFADDLFEKVPKRERVSESESYVPRQVYPGWYFTEPFICEKQQQSFDPLIHKMQTDSLYYKGNYKEALEASLNAVNVMREEQIMCRGSLFRELLECATRCCMKLNMYNQAIELVKQTDEWEVEDPGLFWLKAQVHYAAGDCESCITWCDAILTIRHDERAVALKDKVLKQLSSLR